MSDLSGILSGTFIYDDLEIAVSGLLSSEFNLTSGQILTENEVPDIDEILFTRMIWTYGTLEDVSNNCDQEIPNLNIEIYERKNSGQNYISSLVRKLRYVIKENINVKNSNGSYVKINEVYITRNTNDPEWNAFTLTVSFRIIKAR